MKKKILFLLLLAGVVSIGSSLAQRQPRSKMLPPVVITATKSNVNAEVFKSFEKTFGEGNVTKLSWYQKGRKFLAKFIQNDQQHNVLFRKNGYLIYNIAYGFERHLPAGVLAQIKSKYSDNISLAIHLQQANRDMWLVTLENPKLYTFLKLEDGQMVKYDELVNSATTNPAVAALSKMNF